MNSRRRELTPGTLAAIGALIAMALMPANASADTECSYDGATKTLTVDGQPERGSFLSVNSGTITVNHLKAPSGSDLVDCAGSDPTVMNTDTIDVNHASDAVTSFQISGIDDFAPGATDEGGVLCADEIEVHVELGGPFPDPVFITGPSTSLTLGADGLDWNPVGLCQDVDLEMDATAPFWQVFAGLGSEDFTFSAQGSPATGLPSADRVRFVGAQGSDRFTGGTNHDILDGNRDRDVLRGDKGNDTVTGGPGKRDKLFGDEGRDRLRAKDGKPDKRIDCGPGNDKKAKLDEGKDPDPKSC